MKQNMNMNMRQLKTSNTYMYSSDRNTLSRYTYAS